MAIELNFISIVIPIKNIEELTNLGGVEGAMNHWNGFGEPLHDDHLFKESRMNPLDVEQAVNFWESQGLTQYKYVDGRKEWADLCVVDHFLGPTLPCDWLEYDPRTSTAWLKGTERGEVVSQSPMTKLHKWVRSISERQIKKLPEEEILKYVIERPGHPGQYGFMLRPEFFKSKKEFEKKFFALMKRLGEIPNLKEKMRERKADISSS